MSQQNKNPDTETKPPSTTLPTVGVLIKQTASFTAHRLDLIGYIIAISIVVVLLYYSQSLILNFLGLAIDMVMAFVMMYVCLQDKRVGFREGLAFVWRNFWSWFWIFFLIICVFLAGFVLIIPAVVVMVFVAFALPVFVFSGERGLKALARSTRLVRGNWWAVFGRLFGFTVMTIVVLIIGALIAGWFFTKLSLWFNLLLIPFAMIPRILLFRAWGLIYHSLAANKKAEDREAEERYRTRYRIIVWVFGPAAAILLPLGLYFAFSLAASVRPTADQVPVQIPLSNEVGQAPITNQEIENLTDKK